MAKHSSKEAKDHVKKVKDAEISPDKYFVLSNGTPVKNIHELAMMLDNLSEEEFGHHVSEEKNDFSNWIRDVFNEPELADALGKIKCRKESQIFLLKHVVTKK